MELKFEYSNFWNYSIQKKAFLKAKEEASNKLEQN